MAAPTSAGGLGAPRRAISSRDLRLVAELHRKDHQWIAAAAVKTCGMLPFQFRPLGTAAGQASPSMSLAPRF
jgi:hypothetical protein